MDAQTGRIYENLLEGDAEKLNAALAEMHGVTDPLVPIRAKDLAAVKAMSTEERKAWGERNRQARINRKAKRKAKREARRRNRR